MCECKFDVERERERERKMRDDFKSVERKEAEGMTDGVWTSVVSKDVLNTTDTTHRGFDMLMKKEKEGKRDKKKLSRWFHQAKNIGERC